MLAFVDHNIENLDDDHLQVFTAMAVKHPSYYYSKLI